MGYLCFTSGFGLQLPSTVGVRVGLERRGALQFCHESRDPAGMSLARLRNEPRNAMQVRC